MREFKLFALRGNLLDLVIGIALAGGVGRLTSALVGDVVMPFLNHWFGKDPVGQGAPAFNLANLFQVLVDFAFLALVLYLIFLFVHRLRKASPGHVSAMARQEQLLTEIRDLLSKT
jgi:large conductance mechanosensitive channel